MMRKTEEAIDLTVWQRVIRRMHGLPLYIKGLIVVAIPLAGLLAVSVAFYFVQRENQSAETWVSHTLEVRSEIQMVHTRLEEAESGMLGYLITRDESWLEPFREAQKSIPGTLGRLESMLADNPARLARARSLDHLVTEYLKDLSSLPQRVPQVMGPAAPHPAIAEGRYSLEAVHQELDRMRAEEDRLLDQRRAHAKRVWDQGYAVIAAGILFVPAAAILAMLLFVAAISQRVETLEDNARRLARGMPISPMRLGTDEIGLLEQSLAEAASLLAEREQQLRGAADVLEARVGERTAELANTNQALEAEVDERTRAEEQLAETNQRLRALIDASPLAIIRLDLDGNVMSWNRAAEQIFGWTEEEVVNRPLPTVPGGEEERFRDLLTSAARGETLNGFEAQRRRKDGRLIDIRLWTAPLVNAAGEIRGKIVIAADFTQQRRLEEQFIQAQKMEAIGRLAGGVAHDFNNVITVVSGYGHMLSEGVKDDPVLRDAADEVLKAADRAAALSGQLLAFSRRQFIQPNVVDLNALVSNLQRMLGRVIGEDVEMKVILRPGAANVRADAGQIEQVIMNLAVNARDAMPNGGRLTVEITNVELDENYTRTHAGVRPGPYVMLAVSDTGVGMDAETRAHLFEPFFTTKERGKGTGLGLSTVYGIVKQHGGDIWVYSEPGKGSTFKIYLPQAGKAAAAAATAPEAPRPKPGTETVLVVEDEEGVRRLVREILESHGYTVLEADSGAKALEIGEQRQGPIDLLVTDVVMPQMSGRDLAEALMMLRPDMKVLFLSGYADRAVVEHGVIELGAGFLQKPFTPQTLAQKVREALDRRAAR